MKAADPTACPACLAKERENAQLRRDLEEAGYAGSYWFRKWLEVTERKGGKK